MRMLAVNRDIMIRTAALIAAFLFFTAQGARAGDVTLAANAVLNNFLLSAPSSSTASPTPPNSSAAAPMARATSTHFAGAVRLVVIWGFGFALAVTAVFAAVRAGADRRHDRERGGPARRAGLLLFVILSPLLGVFAFAYDGVYIGATWARDMRNLMVLSLLIFLAAWFALRSFGNAGLWGAFLVHYAARGGLEALTLSGAVEEVVRVSWRSRMEPTGYGPGT